MYTSHFGLTEAPFSITPDPRYLYLSDRHREALAHLLYGIGEGGGFVQLTGEVGTGKTTLCRTLIEQIPAHVDVALVLNPKVTVLELLAGVCDELRIPYPRETASLKVLVDALYAYLLDAHKRGRRTVLILDEAQNLAPDVLEQIRLLTNLETATEKLLQIILIGQPELIPLLDSPRLRQLAQRVTARYHLEPLSESDTLAYIRHRLAVAGRSDVIFSDAAMRQVHRLSRGIPRLINVICDRALLGAYAHDRTRVDAVMARRAAVEVLGHPGPRRRRRALWWTSAMVVALAAVAGLWRWLPEGPWTARLASSPALSETAAVLPGQPAATTETSVPEAVSAVATPGTAPAPVSTTAEGAIDAPRLATILADPSVPTDKRTAFARLLARWGLDPETAGAPLVCEEVRREGLACLFRSGSFGRLRRFDLPGVIELRAPRSGTHFALVAALSGDAATLEFGERRFTLPPGEIERHWDGQFVILWRPPRTVRRAVFLGMRGNDVEWLRDELAKVDGQPADAPVPDLYDEELRARVMAFQRSRSLAVDGIVGEETLSRLVTEGQGADTPRLSRSRSGS